VVTLWGLMLVTGALKNEKQGASAGTIGTSGTFGTMGTIGTALFVFMAADFNHFVIVFQDLLNVGTVVIRLFANAGKRYCAVFA
jgi:hypothetical protein